MLLTQVLLVVPAGIAGTQRPWRAVYIHLPVFWIPAIAAGYDGCVNSIEGGLNVAKYPNLKLPTRFSR